MKDFFKYKQQNNYVSYRAQFDNLNCAVTSEN